MDYNQPSARDISQFEKTIQICMANVSILLAFEELNLYECITSGRSTVKEISEHCSTTERNISLLLDALSAMGLIHKKDDKVIISPLLDIIYNGEIQLPYNKF